jgi:hypothetical protein
VQTASLGSTQYIMPHQHRSRTIGLYSKGGPALFFLACFFNRIALIGFQMPIAHITLFKPDWLIFLCSTWARIDPSIGTVNRCAKGTPDRRAAVTAAREARGVRGYARTT